MTDKPTGREWKKCSQCGEPLPLTGTWTFEKDAPICGLCVASAGARQAGKPEIFSPPDVDELEQELRHICARYHVPNWYADQLAHQIRNFGKRSGSGL